MAQDYHFITRKIFQQLKRKTSPFSGHMSTGKDNLFEVLTKAASAKAIEFNIAASRKGRNLHDTFLLPAAMRGVCEDLIVLRFLKSISPQFRQEYLALRTDLTRTAGLIKQSQFFAENNPYQPVFGGGLDIPQLLRHHKAIKQEIGKLGRKIGWNNAENPNISDMAKSIGLKTTYEYLYFISSNFVHFNTQSLLKMGWGPEDGPVDFSFNHMRGYYQSLSIFYGAILILGFDKSFRSVIFDKDPSRQIALIERFISDVHRWPEAITFEEMNEKKPLYLLTHAFGKAMMKHERPNGPREILRELQNL